MWKNKQNRYYLTLFYTNNYSPRNLLTKSCRRESGKNIYTNTEVANAGPNKEKPKMPNGIKEQNISYNKKYLLIVKYPDSLVRKLKMLRFLIPPKILMIQKESDNN